jgi:hypothetical protein
LLSVLCGDALGTRRRQRHCLSGLLSVSASLHHTACITSCHSGIASHGARWHCKCAPSHPRARPLSFARHCPLGRHQIQRGTIPARNWCCRR